MDFQFLLFSVSRLHLHDCDQDGEENFRIVSTFPAIFVIIFCAQFSCAFSVWKCCSKLFHTDHTSLLWRPFLLLVLLLCCCKVFGALREMILYSPLHRWSMERICFRHAYVSCGFSKLRSMWNRDYTMISLFHQRCG